MTAYEKLSEKLRKLSAEYESAGFSFFAITRAVNELKDGTDEAITHLMASGDDNQIALSLCETFIDYPSVHGMVSYCVSEEAINKVNFSKIKNLN